MNGRLTFESGRCPRLAAMDRDGALRQARAAHAMSTSAGSTPAEAASAAAMVEYLVKKFKLSLAEVTDHDDPRAGGGCDALPIDRWGGEEMFFIQAVIGVAGGALSADPFGTAWLAGPKIALPRLHALAKRLLRLYRAEGDKPDRKHVTLDEILGRYPGVFHLGSSSTRRGDKISLWVGLTQRLIERLMPAPTAPDSSSTALAVVPWQMRQAAKRPPPSGPAGAPADGPGREYHVVSVADYEAGRQMADRVLLGEEPAMLAGRRAALHERREEKEKTNGH